MEELYTPPEGEEMGKGKKKEKESKIFGCIEALEKRIVALEAFKESQESRPKESLDATQLETLKTENATLTKEKADLEDKIKALESAKQGVEGEKERLQEAFNKKIDELQKVQAKLEHSEQQAQQDNATLQGKLDRQRTDNDNLEQKLKDVQSNLRRAQEDGAKWQSKSKELDTELDDLKQEKKRLEGELSTAKTDCQNLEDKCSQLEGELKEAQADQKEAKGYQSLALVQLLNLAQQSDQLLKRLEIDKNATLDDLFASKLGQDRLFVLKCIAQDIQDFRKDLSKIQPLIAFFNALFPLLESSEKLTRLSVCEGDNYNPREHATPEDPQPTRGKVTKVHFAGYQLGSNTYKSLVEVQKTHV
ncbi:hypothetical protein [Helicobacter gastrocanis]|nr:hypothetical protein [Helicobacter sp. NHP19-003]